MVPFPPVLSALSSGLLTVTGEAKKQRWEKREGDRGEIGKDIGESERGLKRGG